MKEVDYENLHIYVAKPNRAKAILNKLVFGSYPAPSMIEAMALDDIIAVCRNNPFILSMKYIPMDEHYNKYPHNKLVPGAIYEVVRGDQVPFLIALVNMEEGNVSHLKRINRFGELISKSAYNSTMKKVIGVYLDEEALREDILGIKFDNLAVTADEDESACFYVPKTLYRKEDIEHERFFI